MGELPASHDGATHCKGNAGGGEDSAGPGEPAGQVGGEVGIFLRGQLVGPEVLSTGIGQGAR